ncbi:MAG: metal ABC transporter ATP-binding protein [Oscillospiraceae bacterium]|jgi:zinc transport system ATP-binding protein|nr:metal ABC transporter ATP-binding protein [Oscillospiraceae bacterium]
MALITCQDASFGYEGKTAVSGLCFSVHRGDYLCVVGENGSGKSTLIQGLLRLKAPQAGSVLMGDGLRSDEIGYLPQQTAVQKDFPASVYEVVLSGCLSRRGLRPFYTRRDKADAEANMERLGLTALRSHCYRELSGGQQQRVRLARALCATKTLLLLDEPVAGLDPVMTGELYRLIKSLNGAGLTIIMVSHDVRSAVRDASHILQLQHTQVFFGRTEDYVTSRAGIEFLGPSADNGELRIEN